MSRSHTRLVAILLLAGAALAVGFYTASTLFAAGALGGLALGVIGSQRFERKPPAGDLRPLMAILVDMGDALQETSPTALQQRGGWSQSLFDDVLAHIEAQAPQFQTALVSYLAQPHALEPDCITALLAVDRLSAAYTYWTRLFPPRQLTESMFVLSLLQDLSEKVERAIARL